MLGLRVRRYVQVHMRRRRTVIKEVKEKIADCFGFVGGVDRCWC